MPANVERDLKLLKGYALLSSLLMAGLTLSAFTRPQKARRVAERLPHVSCRVRASRPGRKASSRCA